MATAGDDSKQQTAAPASITSIQNANWHGRIPIQLSIAPTSLSSPTKPRSIHKMVSRMTYLHIGLFDEIMHLHEYAPSSIMGGDRKHMMVVREEPPDSPPKQEQQVRDEKNDDGNNDSTTEDTSEQQQEEITFHSNPTKESTALNNGNGMIKGDEKNDDGNNHNTKEDTSGQQQQQQEEITFHSNPTKESTALNNGNGNDQRIEQSPSSSAAATPTLSFPECWFEDEESGQPLRWQLFVGVLYDLMKGRLIVNNASSPCNLFRNLPWKIRIHFTSYPTDLLLPLDITVPQQHQNDESMSTAKNLNSANQQAQINTLIGRLYRNSLKQALFLQYGSSKVAMSITKTNHEKMWDAVVQTNYDTYHQVNTELQVGVMAPPMNNKLSLTDDLTNMDERHSKELPQLVPVRILLNDKPAIQKPTMPQKKTISEYLKQRPTEILQEDAVMYVSPYTTLGDVLVLCLPDLFAVDDDGTDDCNNAHYSIQGVQPSLSTTIVDLWRSLCHPDQFLYVIVATL
eukprot:CAMPEP_0201710600 /NCGR_PEP_ID=MMETSP0578-20130828/58709_1 /ASSEMBLY_ACC=CAM_ASM_000663 /TAXON_ID=267565 /ORGANISM="Skeletonema grethea, Strain CCMP 1804" /LENGTH=512 /DNA_ID=CAMNT_0048199631 /DNA_START=26 /DNA_END=1565 /DNA_ORIENTATION=+